MDFWFTFWSKKHYRLTDWLHASPESLEMYRNINIQLTYSSSMVHTWAQVPCFCLEKPSLRFFLFDYILYVHRLCKEVALDWVVFLTTLCTPSLLFQCSIFLDKSLPEFSLPGFSTILSLHPHRTLTLAFCLKGERGSWPKQSVCKRTVLLKMTGSIHLQFRIARKINMKDVLMINSASCIPQYTLLAGNWHTRR